MAMSKNLLIPCGFFKIFFAILLILAFGSCTHDAAWVYKKVALLPFFDKRSLKNKDALWLASVPLAPYGYQNLRRPETLPHHINSDLWLNYNPAEDFARALMDELEAAKIFKSVFFASTPQESNYYIEGIIINTNYRGRRLSYGLGILSPALWHFGFPASYISNDLQIKLSLIETKTKKVIFSKNYKANNYSEIGWLYKLPNDLHYFEMLAILYQQFTQDIVNIEVPIK
jgi:hypothetical protein